MNPPTQRWPSWRRDILVQAVLLTLAAICLLGGGPDGDGQNGTGPTRGGAAAAAPFGTLEPAPPAPSPLAAGGKGEEKSPPPPPAQSPAPKQPPEFPPQKASPASGETVWHDRAEESLADKPTATAVEKAPRPVQEMSPAEVAKTLRSYSRWLHQGQFRLTLDFADVSPEQMAATVAFYVLTTGAQRLRVGHAGDAERIEALPPGKLVGDLPRTRWPAALHDAGLHWFGPNHGAAANILLSDACQVRIYRLLARAVDRRPPEPGDEFLMRLRPGRAREIDLELVQRRPAPGIVTTP